MGIVNVVGRDLNKVSLLAVGLDYSQAIQGLRDQSDQVSWGHQEMKGRGEFTTSTFSEGIIGCEREETGHSIRCCRISVIQVIKRTCSSHSQLLEMRGSREIEEKHDSGDEEEASSQAGE